MNRFYNNLYKEKKLKKKEKIRETREARTEKKIQVIIRRERQRKKEE